MDINIVSVQLVQHCMFFYDELLAQDLIVVAVYYFDMQMAISAQLLWICLPLAEKGTTSVYCPSNQARQHQNSTYC